MEKEEAILQETFETKIPLKFTDEERLAVIDAFYQFSQNPTSMSAGYGIEKNYPFIGENLKKRYIMGKIAVDKTLAFLKESFEEMRKINYDIYFWRNAIADYVKGKNIETFLRWYDSLYEELNEEEKRRFLFLLHALHYNTSGRDLFRWFACFFDKEERLSQSNMEDFLIRWGLGNILYYRSSSGYEEKQFTPSYFRDNLRERYKEKILIDEKQVEEFFGKLLTDNMRLLEKCSKETIPVFENTMGRVTQTASLTVESSKSYFAISPFALEKIRELIKTKKQNLTKEWKEKLSDILNSFTGENYPYVDLRSIFDIEGAYCWEVRYVETPEKMPIKVSILLSPYIFPLTRYSTILDEMRRTSSSPLNLIFLLMETLPGITDALSYIASQRYLIFLFEEKRQKFYVIEKGALSEDLSFVVDSFLSKFFPFLEKEVQISSTLPAYLQSYMENLKYFNKFPRLVSARNRMLKVEPRLRENIRVKLREKFGINWKDKISEMNPSLVKKCENVIQTRLDKEKAKDFLDGATLGELTGIAQKFSDIFGLNENLVKGFLNILNEHRKVLEHPFEEPQEDLDEKTFIGLEAALKYIESVIY